MKFISIIFFIFSLSLPITSETITITTGEWPPFHTTNRTDKGVMSKVITDAFALENITVEWGFYPWQRAKKMAIDGYVDGSASWEPDNIPELIYSDPTYTSSYVFFHLKTFAFSWNSINDLKNLHIGATLGYGYGEAFDTAEQSGLLHVERVPEDDMNYKKLLANRIDIFPNDKVVGYLQIETSLGIEKVQLFTTNNKPLRTYTFHLVMPASKLQSRRLMDKFNLGLKKLKDNGNYYVIIKELNK